FVVRRVSRRIMRIGRHSGYPQPPLRIEGDGNRIRYGKVQLRRKQFDLIALRKHKTCLGGLQLGRCSGAASWHLMATGHGNLSGRYEGRRPAPGTTRPEYTVQPCHHTIDSLEFGGKRRPTCPLAPAAVDIFPVLGFVAVEEMLVF